MTDLTLDLPGDPYRAFDHLYAFGLAGILEDAGYRCTLHWTDLDPHPVLTGVDWDTAARAVHAHATRATQSDSWVQADGHGPHTAALFSPRVKPMRPELWFAQRYQALDQADDLSALDLAMIGALGEPSYWNDDRGEARPDNGATRWEMKTRNRGEEFVGNRLRKLAASVSARTPEAIRDGLSAVTLVDEAGGNKPDSRTPTGLAIPGPTDNARAWCALWGISFLPVSHRTDSSPRAESSRVAGHIGSRLGGTFYLPFIEQSVPLARLRNVIRSGQLRAVAQAFSALHAPPPSRTIGDRAWLTDRGVVAVALFPVHRSDNANAPERWAQPGRIVLLDN